jgi:hypothetical protein
MVRRAIVDLRDQRGNGRVQFQSEKNCWLRSLATINRIATCTATSTLALVLGLWPTQLAVHRHPLGLWPTFLTGDCWPLIKPILLAAERGFSKIAH